MTFFSCIQQFKQLHEGGAKLTTCDFAGRTPLHLAARYGYKDIVEYILEKGEFCFLIFVLFMFEDF